MGYPEAHRKKAHSKADPDESHSYFTSHFNFP